jgi:hypothetical protein
MQITAEIEEMITIRDEEEEQQKDAAAGRMR